MVISRAFKALCLLVVSDRGILALLPQTGSIRSSVTPLSSPSGYGSDYCRGHSLAASRIATRKRVTTRRRRAAAGGLTMRQTKEEEAKTKMRLRCALVQRCCCRSPVFHAGASKRIVSKTTPTRSCFFIPDLRTVFFCSGCMTHVLRPGGTIHPSIRPPFLSLIPETSRQHGPVLRSQVL